MDEERLITYDEWIKNGRPKDNIPLPDVTYEEFVGWGIKHYGIDWIPPKPIK